MTKSMTVRLDELEHDPEAIKGHEHRLTQIDDLLASIPAKGQLQSLLVRPWTGKLKKGAATKWGVTAGNRRLATLKKLMADKGQVQGDVVVPEFKVHIVVSNEDDAGAYESARAENLQRLPETPVEEFRAFARMAETKPAKEIAAVFGITEKRVQQRLKLAALHPDVLKALEGGKITFEAAQAFTIEPDTRKQAAYLKKANSWELNPGNIKSAFTDKLVRGDSKIAKLVGLKRYQTAGGQVLGDAFDEKASYWISPEIIEKLIDESWAKKVEAWIEDGWLFAERADSLGIDRYGYMNGRAYKRLDPAPKDLTAKQSAEIEKLETRRAEILKAHPSLEWEHEQWDAWSEAHPDAVEDEGPAIPDGLQQEYQKAEWRIRDIQAKAPRAYTAEQKAVSGVAYFVDGDHEPVFGVVKPGTKVPASQPGCGGNIEAKAEARLDQPGTNVSMALSEIATAALKARVATDGEMALRILCASLHAQAMSQYDRANALQIDLQHGLVDPVASTKGVSFEEAIALMRDRTVPELLAALAIIVSANLTVRDGTAGSRRGVVSLMRFVDPDTRLRFDAPAYFAGITKPLIQLAWRDMTPETEAGLPEGKKADMATKAAERSTATGWLPPQLRTPSYLGPHFLTPDEAPAPMLQAAE